MGQIGELFECYLYLRSFLVKIWEFDPLGGQYRRSLPTGLQLILKKYHNVLSLMYFVVTLYYRMGQIGKLFEYYLYLGSFLVKIWAFDPLGCQYRGLPHTVLQLILKKHHHASFWMYLSGYFTWSNWSNCEVICIILIFEVILVKICLFDPPGCPYIGLPPIAMQLILMKYHHDH